MYFAEESSLGIQGLYKGFIDLEKYKIDITKTENLNSYFITKVKY